MTIHSPPDPTAPSRASAERSPPPGVVLGVARPRRRLAVGASPRALVGTTPAHAADGDGWVRVGHLSPDTKAVDVTLTSFSGGQVVMSSTTSRTARSARTSRCPAGTYSVAMTRRATPSPPTPSSAANITVTSGKPITAVAYGTERRPEDPVFEDDLTAPADGQAKIRLVQAANVSEDGQRRDDDRHADRRERPVRQRLRLRLRRRRQLDPRPHRARRSTAPSDVNLAAGSITTLFVLDNSKGGITIVPVVDSAATARPRWAASRPAAATWPSTPRGRPPRRRPRRLGPAPRRLWPQRLGWSTTRADPRGGRTGPPPARSQAHLPRAAWPGPRDPRKSRTTMTTKTKLLLAAAVVAAFAVTAGLATLVVGGEPAGEAQAGAPARPATRAWRLPRHPPANPTRSARRSSPTGSIAAASSGATRAATPSARARRTAC